jgi:hypothetical protein
MEYNAAHTIQIRSDVDVPNGLEVHEDRGDGTPLCGTVNRDWNGLTMHYALLGGGIVSCGSCQRVVDEAARAVAVARAEAERKAVEHAARAERVRAIRASGVRMALPELDGGLRNGN